MEERIYMYVEFVARRGVAQRGSAYAWPLEQATFFSFHFCFVRQGFSIYELRGKLWKQA